VVISSQGVLFGMARSADFLRQLECGAGETGRGGTWPLRPHAAQRLVVLEIALALVC